MLSLPLLSAEQIARGLKARKQGKGWVAKCPAHEDKKPSLSITEKEGKVLVHCWAGCEQKAVIGALIDRGLWPERRHEPRVYIEPPMPDPLKAELLLPRLEQLLDTIETLEVLTESTMLAHLESAAELSYGAVEAVLEAIMAHGREFALFARQWERTRMLAALHERRPD